MVVFLLRMQSTLPHHSRSNNVIEYIIYINLILIMQTSYAQENDSLRHYQ